MVLTGYYSLGILNQGQYPNLLLSRPTNLLVHHPSHFYFGTADCNDLHLLESISFHNINLSANFTLTRGNPIISTEIYLTFRLNANTHEKSLVHKSNVFTGSFRSADW